MTQTTTQTKVSPEQKDAGQKHAGHKHGEQKHEGESCATDKATKAGAEKGSCGSTSGSKGSCG